jgi:hypothetical protein
MTQLNGDAEPGTSIPDEDAESTIINDNSDVLAEVKLAQKARKSIQWPSESLFRLLTVTRLQMEADYCLYKARGG